MKKSNIFVHIELSKLVGGLGTETTAAKNNLKSQAGYFNIITPKYFSDSLSPEWEEICRQVKDKGPKTDPEGRIVANAVINTIEQMTTHQCSFLVNRIISLQLKVQQEFE